MNWVGGSRHRLKLQGEKKLQREFFERQKFGQKTARRYKNLSPKRKHNISQDLRELMTITNTHAENFSVMKPVSRPVKKMDFDKHEQRFGKRLTEDVNLDSSPIKTPSKLQLMEAKDNKRCHTTNKYKQNYLFPLVEEEEEVIFDDEKDRYGSISKSHHRQIIEGTMGGSDVVSKIHTPGFTPHKYHSNNFLQTNSQSTDKFNTNRDVRNENILSSSSMLQTWDSVENCAGKKRSHLFDSISAQICGSPESPMFSTISRKRSPKDTVSDVYFNHASCESSLHNIHNRFSENKQISMVSSTGPPQARSETPILNNSFGHRNMNYGSPMSCSLSTNNSMKIHMKSPEIYSKTPLCKNLSAYRNASPETPMFSAISSTRISKPPTFKTIEETSSSEDWMLNEIDAQQNESLACLMVGKVHAPAHQRTPEYKNVDIGLEMNPMHEAEMVDDGKDYMFNESCVVKCPKTPVRNDIETCAFQKTADMMDSEDPLYSATPHYPEPISPEYKEVHTDSYKKLPGSLLGTVPAYDQRTPVKKAVNTDLYQKMPNSLYSTVQNNLKTPVNRIEDDGEHYQIQPVTPVNRTDDHGERYQNQPVSDLCNKEVTDFKQSQPPALLYSEPSSYNLENEMEPVDHPKIEQNMEKEESQLPTQAYSDLYSNTAEVKNHTVSSNNFERKESPLLAQMSEFKPSDNTEVQMQQNHPVVNQPLCTTLDIESSEGLVLNTAHSVTSNSTRSPEPHALSKVIAEVTHSSENPLYDSVSEKKVYQTSTPCNDLVERSTVATNKPRTSDISTQKSPCIQELHTNCTQTSPNKWFCSASSTQTSPNLQLFNTLSTQTCPYTSEFRTSSTRTSQKTVENSSTQTNSKIFTNKHTQMSPKSEDTSFTQTSLMKTPSITSPRMVFDNTCTQTDEKPLVDSCTSPLKIVEKHIETQNNSGLYIAED